MPRTLSGWIYVKPRDAPPRSKWDIPRSVMRNQVKSLIGLPMLLEHDMAHDPVSFEGDNPRANTAMKIGTIRDATCLDDGSTKITFDIDDTDPLGKAVLTKIDAGVLSGLSLSHRKKGDEYTFLEVSVTCAPKREGTFIVQPGDTSVPVEASDLTDTEGELVCCSRFATRFESNEYMPSESPESKTSANPPNMSEASQDTSMAAPAPTQAQAQAPVPTQAPAPVADPTPAPAVAQAPAPTGETPDEAEKVLAAIRQVARKDLTEKDMAQLETLVDAVNTARLAKKELEEKEEQAKKEIERLEQKHKDDLKKMEEKHFLEARRHWTTILQARAQNPDLAEQSNQGYAIMMECDTSQQINQKMEHFMNTYQKVTNNLVNQVTKGDTGSRDLIMEAFNNSNNKKRTMSAMAAPSSSAPAPAPMAAPVTMPMPVAANNLSDVFSHHRQKTQTTGKVAPTKFEELVFNAAIRELEKDPNNQKITLTEANNLVHDNVKALLSGRAHAFRSIDEMNALLAFQTVVVAAKSYPLTNTSQLVSCSALGRNMFGNDDADGDIIPSETSVLQQTVAKETRGMAVSAVPFYGTETTSARDFYR